MKKAVLLFLFLAALNVVILLVPASWLADAFQGTTALADTPTRIFLPVIASKSAAFFVSPNGSDANPGTWEQPWRTIGKAARTAKAGDLVYIRAGTYNESAHFVTSGTAASPIQIMAYPGEQPVMEGKKTSGGEGSALLWIEGDYIDASGIEVRNSPYYGILVLGSYDTVENMYVHHSSSTGILITRGHGSLVQNNRIWWNSAMNQDGRASYYGAGVSAALAGVSYATIRRNTVWENWGEGISTFRADRTVIEENTVHDNFSANIYISDSTNILCQRNLIYMDPASSLYGSGDQVGIMMGDETYNPPSANITIINNVAVGNHDNFMWWQGNKGGGMLNVLIANNTFVNGTGDPTHGEGGVTICKGDHQNVRFENNLVQQDGDLPVIATIQMPGVSYSHNLWSKKPYTAASSPTDVTGDPRLARAGGNAFAAQWYKLSASSPAINRGQALPEVTVDYFGKARDSRPDMGAAEYVP